MAECSSATIMRMLKKYMVPTYAKSRTAFISRADAIKLFSLPFEDCQKYLYNIRQRIDK